MNNTELIFLSVIFILTFAVILMAIRNHLVFKFRMKILDDWCAKNHKLIPLHVSDSSVKFISLEMYEKKILSYNSMVFCFWIWNFNKMIDKEIYEYLYGDIEDTKKDIS